jgi:hypothetical protein
MRNARHHVNSCRAFPEILFDGDLARIDEGTFVNNMIVEEMKERKNETDKYLEEFCEQTNRLPSYRLVNKYMP